MSTEPKPLVGIVMGSRSDWPTLEHASAMLDKFGVAHECQLVSAHRTPDRLVSYARQARDRGLQLVIAGAGGAAHLPGMLAAMTTLPVLGVPVATASSTLGGVDALLSIVQMPKGVPVPTLAIGPAGAVNAALTAVSVLSLHDADLAQALVEFRARQREAVEQEHLP